MGFEAGDIRAVHRHAARGRLKHTGDGIKKRGLARAIGPDQPRDGAALYGQARAIDGMKPAEMLVKVLNFDNLHSTKA